MNDKICCIDCGTAWPKDRHHFPWGSKKPKVCTPCIEVRFYYAFVGLDINWDAIVEEVNGSV